MGKGQLGGAPSWFKKITDKIRRDISNTQGQNVITYPYYESSKTENGVQFSIRSDGSIKVNGHATADTYFKIHSHLMRDGNLTVPFGIYTLSGAPKGGNPQTCFMQVTMSIAGSECGIITDYGNGGIGDIDNGGDYVTLTDAYIGIKICVKSGTTVPDLIFRPMLEKGTASHEYQPTNLSNKTLKNILSGLGNVSDAIADAKKAGTDAQTAINNHIGNKNNPHAVTKAQVGLGNVGDFKAVSTEANQGLTITEKSNARANIGAGTSSFSGYYRDLRGTPTIPTDNNQLTNGAGYLTNTSQVIRDAKNHIGNKNNPHAVTASQIKAVSTEANQGLTDTEKLNARANIGAANNVSTVTAGSFDSVNNIGGTYLKVNEALSTAASKIVSISSVLNPLKTNVELFMDDVTGHMGTTNISEIGDGTVTGGLSELNSNLDGLEFGEVAGGKNLIDVSKVIRGELVEGTYCEGNNYVTDFIHLEYGKNYILSNCYKTAHETAWFTQDKKYIQRTFGTTMTPPTNDCYYARIEYGVEQGIKAQLEEGTQATPYKPYIPSVKMLADENEQQNTKAMDLKMLGWVVPSECPVQNYVDSDGVFHQRVGRVDLGSLIWAFNTGTDSLFYTNDILNAKTRGLAVYNKYKGVTGNSYGYAWGVLLNDENYKVTYINASGYTDPVALKRDLTGVYLYYELAEEITTSVDGNEAVTKVNESLSVIGKCKNLLKPTLQTTTQNGVTCTNNGDGTYTLNGTATQDTSFYVYIREQDWEVGKTYRIIGCPSGGSRNSYFISPFYGYYSDSLTDYGNGCTFTVTDDVKSYTTIIIYIRQGNTFNNLVFKPMLTTNLSATYDDFVPYTGDGETLTADVAELKNDLAELDETVSNINGSNLKTSATKTASITSSISNSIASGTALDAAIQTLLNNDKTLDTKSDEVDNKSISTYDANAYYSYGNVVYYEGKVYRHIKVSSGSTPGVKGQVPTNTEYWKEVTVSDLFKELSLASNILSSLTLNDFDYSGGPTQIGAPPYTVNKALTAIAGVLSELKNSNSIKVFNYNLPTSFLAASHDHEIHLTLPSDTILAVIPQGYTATMDWNTIVHIRYYDMDRHVLCIWIGSGIEQQYIFHYTVLYK